MDRNRCAIRGIEEANIQRVQQIEAFRKRFQVQLLRKRKGARDAQIHGLIAVALERVARLDADPVVVAEDVAIRVETANLVK